MKSILLLPIAGAALFLGACNMKESVSEQASTVDAYPLKVCVVSGEELGSMGEPVLVTHEGVTVKFCCKSCIDEFNQEPAKYVAKVTAAMPK